MPIHDWNLILSQLAFFFEDRLDGGLNYNVVDQVIIVTQNFKQSLQIYKYADSLLSLVLPPKPSSAPLFYGGDFSRTESP